MNNDRVILIENMSDSIIGLKDTQNRNYILVKGGKQRISQVSLQDILDYPASKVFFTKGLVAIKNIDADALYLMGLTEEEIKVCAPEAAATVKEEVVAPVVEEAPTIEEIKEEIKQEVIEEVKEEIKEEPKVVKKPTTKKSTAKKSTKKSSKK